jgi:hypothetical protein
MIQRLRGVRRPLIPVSYIEQMKKNPADPSEDKMIKDDV